MSPAPDKPPPPSPETVELSPGVEGAPPEPRKAPTVTRAFGDYELLGEIERGGMGVVFQARERSSGRLVALKMMLDQSASSQADLSRFALEAQAAGELHHPGIVAIHAWGVHEGHPFYTMDFVPGRPLHKVLAEGPLPLDRAVRYWLGTARALAAAHALGIVHRDLKPSNIMIDSADQPRVLDFGLAKRRRAEPSSSPEDEILDVIPLDVPPSEARSTPQVSAPVTEKGAILGTPSYMAPEQVRADHQRVGPPADVHALGAIFYGMVAGRPPFLADSTYGTLMQVLKEEPTPLRSVKPEVPSLVESVCLRCLAKSPRDRYPDAGALADDLERRWQQARHGTRFTRLALLAALALVLLQVVQPMLIGPRSSEPGSLTRLMLTSLPRLGAPHVAAALLDRLLHGLLVFGGPLLAGLGLLVWASAWVWYAPRRGRIVLGWVLAALAGLLAWLLASGVPEVGTAFLPWVLLANAVTVVVVAVFRTSSLPESGTAPAAEGDSYLQRLFAVRPAPRAKQSTTAATNTVELADFEMGKRLHIWDGGAVHWARQRSLARPVLVWRDSNPSPAGTVPGVVVRHPAVLGLHAVCAAPDGRLLVTELVAASPLAEVLNQRPLIPREAVRLTIRLADALQAFHDQGAAHGRLSPDWILVNGDLEPALCPCGVPSQAADDRAADLRALGRLLESWLPRRPFGWRFEALAAVHRACDAARDGEYDRPADLAADLDRAEQAGRVRWRERWGNVLIGGLLLVPWLLVPLRWLFDTGAAATATDWPGLLPTALAFLCPAAVFAGYAQARSLVQLLRLRRAGRDRILSGGTAPRVLQAVAFAALGASLLAAGVLDDGGSLLGSLPVLLLVLTGFWATGGGLAGIITFGELLARSLRRLTTPVPGPAP